MSGPDLRRWLELLALGPESHPVTVQTVGEEAYFSDPLASAAVRSGMLQDEFIRLLLKDREELLSELVRLRAFACEPLRLDSSP